MPLRVLGGLLMDAISFSDIAIVSCGTLSIELNDLRKEGFLDTGHLFLLRLDSMRIFVN
jgi:hypothetical protein